MFQAYPEMVWVMGESNGLVSVFVPYYCCNKLPHIDGFKQHKCITYNSGGQRSKISQEGCFPFQRL